MSRLDRHLARLWRRIPDPPRTGLRNLSLCILGYLATAGLFGMIDGSIANPRWPILAAFAIGAGVALIVQWSGRDKNVA